MSLFFCVAFSFPVSVSFLLFITRNLTSTSAVTPFLFCSCFCFYLLLYSYSYPLTPYRPSCVQTYEGEWSNGQADGHGEHTWLQLRLPGSQYTTRNRFVGQFTAGARQGPGVFYYADGGLYEGHWEANHKHGTGTLTYANGTQVDVEFDSDRLLTSVPPEASKQFTLAFGDLHATDDVVATEQVNARSTLLTSVTQCMARAHIKTSRTLLTSVALFYEAHLLALTYSTSPKPCSVFSHANLLNLSYHTLFPMTHLSLLMPLFFTFSHRS